MVTVGYNASIGFDRVVEFQGFWHCFEFLTQDIVLPYPLSFGLQFHLAIN
jgi:hypothetical protein